MKEIKINVPEGYEIDSKNSTFECIKFKPKELTYNNVAKELFYKGGYIIREDDCKIHNSKYIDYENKNVATSKKQLEKLLAINQLMNVAKYLNDDWKPDWNNTRTQKWIISIDKGKVRVCGYHIDENSISVYFKTKELAQQAIEILGEDTIRLALSTDW